MKLFIKLLIANLQYLALLLSYYLCKLFLKKSNKIAWIIGVDEIAKFIYLLKGIFENSYAVSFSKNKFYTLRYDFTINIKNKYFAYAYRLLFGPILLGYLMNKSDKFLYIWSTGFLIDRKYEFEFLKSKDKKIVCIFLGVFIWTHDSFKSAVMGKNTKTDKKGIVRKKTKIGSNCFIGGPSVIMPGVTIGDKCIISPMSVIYEDLPDKTIYQPYKSFLDFKQELEEKDRTINEIKKELEVIKNKLFEK